MDEIFDKIFENLGANLESCYCKTAADSILVVRILLEDGVSGISERFSVDSLGRAYKFLCGSDLETDFEIYNKFYDGN